MTALKDKDVVLRIRAAEGLGHLGDDRALPELEWAVTNDQGVDEFGESVAETATKAIERINNRMQTETERG